MRKSETKLAAGVLKQEENTQDCSWQGMSEIHNCVYSKIITWIDRALPNFRHFDEVVLSRRLDPYHCFTSTPCLSSSLLPSSYIIFYLSAYTRRKLSKALVFLIVLFLCCCIGECIYLELFYLFMADPTFEQRTYSVQTHDKKNQLQSTYLSVGRLNPFVVNSLFQHKISHQHPRFGC